MPRTHISISGHTLEYPDPSALVAKFLRQLEKMLYDPNTSAVAMTGFAYSTANPILDHAFFPERGPITKDTFADPHYPVIQDMLARKRAAEEGVDLEKLAATYTVTVPEAATIIGMREASLRNAIHSRRIHSWFRDGRHYLTPASVRSFEVGDQGFHRQYAERIKKQEAPAEDPAAPPPPALSEAGARPLEMCFGNMKGASFRVKHAGEIDNQTPVGPNMHTGPLAQWKRVAVLSGKHRPDGTYGSRLFILTPSDTANEVTFDPFYVRGHFNVEKVNAPRKAAALFKEFVAE